jgi:cytochrome P450
VLFFQLTLDSATEFLFGESVGSLNSTEGSEQYRFGKAFDLAQVQLETRRRLLALPYILPKTDFEKACDTVHAFVDKIVFKVLRETEGLDPEKTSNRDSKPDGDSKPERYVFLTEMAKSTRDPKQLRDETLNILVAGRDTTASLLSHTFHVLARRPDIFNKLKAEVDELNGEKPDYETLKAMKYLRYLLTEALRVYPVVPSNARFANKDTTIPRGGGPDGQSPVYVPKGGVVTYNVFAMHRRKDIYGPDADEFRPERWAPEENLRPGWGYLPFNGGPRICVGQQFALTEASYTIVRLLQEFKAIESRDGSEWSEILGLTLAVGNGVKVAMIPK